MTFGPGGVIAHLPKDAIHVSMSTIIVALSKRFSLAHAKAGQRYVGRAPRLGCDRRAGFPGRGVRRVADD
jgi:3-hydroxyisobutyrate dehydrogenase-like beta-hydroxyacid dehydrogenase